MVTNYLKGGAMLQRFALCLGVLTIFLFFGCGNKETEQTQNTPALSDMPEVAESGRDTADIFDEFYDEDISDDSFEDPSGGTAGGSTQDSYSSYESYTANFDPNGRYVVQVSTIGDKPIADDVAAKFEKMGYPTYLAEVQNPTPELIGSYYRVRIGGFNGVSDAKAFGENALLPQGYDYWVDNRSNDNVGIDGYGLGEGSVAEYEDSYTPSTTTESTTEGSDWGTSSSSSDSWGTSTTEASTEDAGWNTDETGSTSASTDDSWGTSSTETATEAVPATESPAASDNSWGTESATASGDSWDTSESSGDYSQTDTGSETTTTTEPETSAEPTGTESSESGTAPSTTEEESTDEGWGDDWGEDWGDSDW